MVMLRRIFAVYEYLALFAIVLMHEFGHALACRQTGGEANRSCFGHSAEWLSFDRRRGRARSFGVSRLVRW